MAKIGVIMGSISDWETMKECCAILDQFEVVYDKEIVSAHRTPNRLFEYAEQAIEKGFSVIIAAAGGAAHLPGMIASKTILPVIGVPIQSKTLNGIDSLLSIVQMPAGVPVATVAIGVAGAKNAALLAIQILSTQPENEMLRSKLFKYKEKLEMEAIESNQQLK
jgi:5-(carboxyamino)imidazole ribonucleotide mutase